MGSTLNVPLHVKYIQSLGEASGYREHYHSNLTHFLPQNTDDLIYHMTAHLRMNAVYWGLTALCVMKDKDALNREEMIDFVMSCWDEKTGQSFCMEPIQIDDADIQRIRWFQSASRSRRTSTPYTECHPDLDYAGRTRPSGYPSSSQVYVSKAGERLLSSTSRYSSLA